MSKRTTAEIYVQERELVLPGQKLARGMKPGGNAFIDESGIVRSAVVGLVSVQSEKIDVIPLSSSYIPRPNDIVLGKVTRITGTTILVDINTPMSGIILIPRGSRRHHGDDKYDLKVGDVVLAKIKSFDNLSSPLLTIDAEGLGKITRGILIKVNSAKIPRIIGKKGSMVNLLSSKSHSEIIVAQNGYVLVNPQNLKSLLAIKKALSKIQEESHVAGLSNRISRLLDEEMSGGS